MHSDPHYLQRFLTLKPIFFGGLGQSPLGWITGMREDHPGFPQHVDPLLAPIPFGQVEQDQLLHPGPPDEGRGEHRRHVKLEASSR